MRRKQEIKILILGDHSLCFEHVLRSYYNLKTGQDAKFILKQCESRGIDMTVGKKPVNVNISVATTRTGMSRASMDKTRIAEYKRLADEVDVILLGYFLNNSKTLFNVRNKYLDEIKTYFPKTPYFLLGVNIEEYVDGSISSIKETINIQDRWLKRDLEVSPKEAKRTARKIKAHGTMKCSILHTLEESAEENHNDEGLFDYDLDKSKTVKTALDKVVKFAMKRKNAPCILPFRP